MPQNLNMRLKSSLFLFLSCSNAIVITDVGGDEANSYGCSLICKLYLEFICQIYIYVFCILGALYHAPVGAITKCPVTMSV